LATAYKNRIRVERAENLEQAVETYQLALQVYTREAFPEDWAMTQNNLANAYKNRIRGGRAENLEQAISAYQLALQVRTRDAFPKECRQTARNLGNLYFEQRNWEAVTVAYTNALAAAEILYQSCILLDGKAAELAETADLPRRTAYALARSGHLKAAVLGLEQGRARGLSESLDRDRADLNQLQELAPTLYDQYQSLTTQLRNLENQQRDRTTSDDRQSLTPEALRETAIALRQQLDSLLQEIRHVPGYEIFLALPTFNDVQRAVPSERPLVYLVPTPAGGLALIVTTQDIQSIWLDDLTETNLVDLLKTWFAAYRRSQSDRQAWFAAIDSVTRQLWEPLMAPLIHQIKAHNFHQATLIPAGLLSFLPLHAAWVEDTTCPTGRRYALDDIHFTYAPNAKSLTAAEAIVDRVQSDSILAIDNPSQDLTNSGREITCAIDSFPLLQRTVLRHADATMEKVRSHLSKAAIVHFSCHGTANLTDPLNSGLVMSDGLLTLRDILALNLAERSGIRLAILSACETGLSGIENADEAISLPTGLLQAGVAGVVASLWSVADLSTMLLLTKFYDLWRGEKSLPPNQALRQAQIWLRDTTEGEIAPLLEQRTSTPSNRLFAHPYYWSAFSYTGL